MGGVVGLDYSAIFTVAGAMGIALSLTHIKKLRVIEATAIEVINKEKGKITNEK